MLSMLNLSPDGEEDDDEVELLPKLLMERLPRVSGDAAPSEDDDAQLSESIGMAKKIAIQHFWIL